MADALANVNITTDTFNDWLTKTNELCYKVSSIVLTANSTLGVTTGNAFVNGYFSANSLIALNDIRGGNNSTSNTLNVSSNALMQNTVLTASGALTYANDTANQIVDTFSVSTYRSTKYLLQVNTVYGFQTTEILLLPDGGSNVYSTEYATLSTNGNLATFSANVFSGNVNLMISPVVNSTAVKFEKSSITI